jgi:hypothetical protein
MEQKRINLMVVALALISLILIQPGCEKDSNDPDTSSSSIEGLWVGLYTVDGQPNLGQRYYSLVINPDGTVINDTELGDKHHIKIGTWTMKGGSFECTATCVYGLPVNIGTTETYTATLDKRNGTFTNGIWKNVPPIVGSGTFTLTKVK